MTWRFYPLAEYPHSGVLISPEHKPRVAQFFTPAHAKAERRKQLIQAES